MRKTLFVVVGIVIIGHALPTFAATTQTSVPPTIQAEKSPSTSIVTLIQELSIDSTYSEQYRCYRSGIHIKPSWQWNRFEGQFDFALYQNPWSQDEWQLGEPIPGLKPILPNFIDSFKFHGQRLEILYQKNIKLNFGHGLIINEYQPFNPYHGWLAIFTPTETTQATLFWSQDVNSLSPFFQNDLASLQVLRFDQSFNSAGLQWKIGVTAIHDPMVKQDAYPTMGGEYDITLANWIWLSPFWESGGYERFGRADMFGLKGNLGLVNYQVGGFQTTGEFIPNFFGQVYDDLKWNTHLGIYPILPDVHQPDHSGVIGRLGVRVSPWLALDCFYINDVKDILGIDWRGKIERLKLEYGFLYYDQLTEYVRYHWFIQSFFGYLGYKYRYDLDWHQRSHHSLEISYKF